MSAANTKNKHVAIQTSIAFMYETFGRLTRAPELCVVIVKTVKSPKDILAGVESMFNQNETHERHTIRALGMYIWII
jgi:hypothetical protein